MAACTDDPRVGCQPALPAIERAPRPSADKSTQSNLEKTKAFKTLREAAMAETPVLPGFPSVAVKATGWPAPSKRRNA